MIGISTSTYYYKPKRDRLERTKEDLDIKSAIEKIRKDLPVAGYRTLQRYLLVSKSVKQSCAGSFEKITFKRSK